MENSETPNTENIEEKAEEILTAETEENNGEENPDADKGAEETNTAETEPEEKTEEKPEVNRPNIFAGCKKKIKDFGYGAKIKYNNLNKKRLGIICGSILLAAAVVYFSGVIYYSYHFMARTHIGTFDCSNMSAEKAREYIQNEIDNYAFTFYEKGGKTETIKGDEIYFSCTGVEDLKNILNMQNPFRWVTFQARQLPNDVSVSYNEDVLYNRITEMNFMADSRSGMEGSTSKIKYENGQYTVEDNGSAEIVSTNNVFNRVRPKIYQLYKGMSLEKEGCYQGMADDDTMKGVLAALNKYVNTKVTYIGSRNGAVLDKNTISQWLTVDENYNIHIDEKLVRDYINNLAQNYDSVGKERTFKTTGGNEVKISGGNYGWLVNNQKETEELLNIIRSGETVEREPVYKQKAAAHNAADIANTYVEVSIGAQHLWFYKDGKLVVSTDVVTGNPYRGHATPSGVYRVAFKDRNAVLRGQGYASPVSYWMPFNGGIGLHDATWRGAFGGSIYRGGGSHGCVNMPFSAAKTTFENISPGDPVVVY